MASWFGSRVVGVCFVFALSRYKVFTFFFLLSVIFNIVNWRNLEKLMKHSRIGEIQQTFNISLVLKASSFWQCSYEQAPCSSFWVFRLSSYWIIPSGSCFSKRFLFAWIWFILTLLSPERKQELSMCCLITSIPDHHRLLPVLQIFELHWKNASVIIIFVNDLHM